MSLRPAIPMREMRGHVITSQPASEPVAVADLRSHLRLDDTSEDALLAIYIAAARQHVENVAGLAFVDQTWKLTLDRWPGGREPWWDGVRQLPVSELRQGSRDVILPRYPLLGVDSVTTYDDGRNATSVTVADVFLVDASRWPGRLALLDGKTWPVALANAAAIEVVYRAGFGTVPSALVLAVMRMAAMLFERRGDGCTEAEAYAASGAQGSVEAYRVRDL